MEVIAICFEARKSAVVAYLGRTVALRGVLLEDVLALGLDARFIGVCMGVFVDDCLPVAEVEGVLGLSADRFWCGKSHDDNGATEGRFYGTHARVQLISGLLSHFVQKCVHFPLH